VLIPCHAALLPIPSMSISRFGCMSYQVIPTAAVEQHPKPWRIIRGHRVISHAYASAHPTPSSVAPSSATLQGCTHPRRCHQHHRSSPPTQNRCRNLFRAPAASLRRESHVVYITSANTIEPHADGPIFVLPFIGYVWRIAGGRLRLDSSRVAPIHSG